MVTGISFSQTSILVQLLILSFTFSFYYNYICSAQKHNPDICFNFNYHSLQDSNLCDG